MKAWTVLAQRRPGPRPRRHVVIHGVADDTGLRSTKAGAETPATQPRGLRHGRSSDPLNEGRGRDPGDTRTSWESWRRSRASLNEGRGRDPGDTTATLSESSALSIAQRRPGPRPRRHVAWWAPRSRSSRSTKAGAETPATPSRSLSMCWGTNAQRRPGPRPRRHADRRLTVQWRSALNEGRGRDPGDTLSGLHA